MAGSLHESFKGSILAEAFSDLNSFLVRYFLQKWLKKQEFLPKPFTNISNLKTPLFEPKNSINVYTVMCRNSSNLNEILQLRKYIQLLVLQIIFIK